MLSNEALSSERDEINYLIERRLGWLKETRGIGPRYENLARRFLAMVTLACILGSMRQYFAYRT